MRIEVKVKTNSGRSEIVEDVVYVKAQPENGKANIEVVKLFTKKFKKPAKIVKGFTSKKKVIEI
jgi:uncharacterized protein (TIGR00251 family)